MPIAPTAPAAAMPRRATLAAATTLVAHRARAGQATPGPIVLGQVSLSFYAVTGAVVQAVLERLGHSVTLVEGAHDGIFPRLGAGEIDLMAAAWLPEGHGAYWSRHGGAAQEVATLYQDARFFWAVPGYVPAAEVASIADLARPAVAARMTRLIQSIGSSAGITTASARAVEAYGLAPLGYELRPGSQAEWIGAYQAAQAERRWMVFPTWAPQYLNRGDALRPLADPRGLLGGANRGVLVAPRARFQALPPATQAALSRISLGLDGVTEMDWMVQAEGLSPAEAARRWMAAHADRVAGWLAG